MSGSPVAVPENGVAWSGSPARTVTSQVPQVPYRQDVRTWTPAFWSASRTLRSGETVTDSPTRVSSTSKAVSRTGAPLGLGGEMLQTQEPVDQSAQWLSTAVSRRCGPQKYALVSLAAPPMNCRTATPHRHVIPGSSRGPIRQPAPVRVGQGQGPKSFETSVFAVTACLTCDISAPEVFR